MSKRITEGVIYRYEDTVVFEYESIAPDSQRQPLRSVWTGGTRREAEQIVSAIAATSRALAPTTGDGR